ncbi:MAG: type IX secretion system plug protein domain-containing protein, partial [Bacteroidota bacterium]
MNRISLITGLLLLFTTSVVVAQNTDRILDDQVRSVKLSVMGAPLSMPIVDIKAPGGVLNLEFDHLGDELRDYAYTILHCNRDWSFSELDQLEYIDGFTEDRITSIEPSFNTITQYTHYTLRLPNQNVRWSKSGNYILRITDKEDDRVVLERRFMVVEPQWRIDANL